MSRKGAFRIACALAGAAMVAGPTTISACTFLPVFPFADKGAPPEPPDYSDACEAVLAVRETVLAELKNGERSFSDYYQVAHALRYGTAGCEAQPEFAFAMIDAAIGSPARPDGLSDGGQRFLDWAPEELPRERYEEVLVGLWLLRSGYTTPIGPCGSGPSVQRYVLPAEVPESTLLTTIAGEAYWPSSLRNFGLHPRRDELVLKQLIDPEGPHFDLWQAKLLAPQFYGGDRLRGSLPILVEVAEAITDPRLTKPDYDAAAALLYWYSPYASMHLGESYRMRAEALWVRIAQTRLTDPDPEVRRKALFLLQTRDPAAQPGKAFAEVLPEGAEVIVLEDWPESLPPLRGVDRLAAEILADRYPSRARRENQTGRVELGILFKPDGTFHSVHVTRGTGTVLDEAAQRDAERYMRPRLRDMVLGGFGGSYVYVPLPSFEYRLVWSMADANGLRGLQGDTINVYGQIIEMKLDPIVLP